MTEPSGLRHGPVVPQLESLLRELLREKRWKAGERLPSEVRLAEELGVGRSSVREAIRLLARDGLVDVRHGSGTFVTDLSPVTEEEPDVRRLLRRARLLEAYEVRRALEVEAARLAAQRIRPEDVERLRARLRDRQERSCGEPSAFVDADLEFHRAIVELSGNDVLVGLFTLVRPVLREALIEMVAHETALPDVSCAHADVLEALARGDAEAAIAATVDNLESTMAFIRAEAADR
ncbi:FadR/GntR family transcriptional regulator [Streptosporangium carneum]|uniref:GntR family transcriptional regulator n=1 Tax=Streptosporangium carneum TaxID=47481 RepID=A0A9W6HYL2_9ACTN|nr:FadR/GntR family transcriptional regulator [Streptosporangium carneum]GLK08448.1 GntR family transcriptional regulator [Streptosporangium carneum]